ncbi:hypothetical protein [Spirosoma pollinicola]|uniref:Outer membrane protein beta-barrel domain-containing protein n=1 Tax=Spirosoma pollinicola TaxID=2057025 RepID=A0A2K8YY71_9BACT|nr:hypothetical protein [Spirosoma pollinicola]AUD02534.1 hypothetical protein CWM47_12250 [Spirosoma pollinicola]
MKQLFGALLILSPLFTYAQSPVSARLSSGYDLGMAYSESHYNPSLTYYQLINIGEHKTFSLGWTGRLAAFYGDNLNYYTAPARLTRGKSGFGALSGPLLVDNIDTVRYDYVSMTSFNLGIRAQVNLGLLELGASADLLGLSFGKSRTGRYQSSTGQFNIQSSTGTDSTTAFYQGSNTFQKSHPSLMNLRLLSDNDRGTLATEVYARLKIGQRIGVKVSYQWLTTETTVSKRDVISDNNRFRNRANMAYIALTIPVFY